MIGINLHDGGALVAFRMRDDAGGSGMPAPAAADGRPGTRQPPLDRRAVLGGAVRLLEGGREIARGCLETTGYGERLRM